MFDPYIPMPAGVAGSPDMTGYGGRPGGFPGLMMALGRLQAMTGVGGAAPMTGAMPMGGMPMGGMPMGGMPMGGMPMGGMPMGGVCPCCGRPVGAPGMMGVADVNQLAAQVAQGQPGFAVSFDGGAGFGVTPEG